MFYLSLRNVFRGLFWFLFRLTTNGKENIPMQGPVILCCNHISLLDPPILGTPLSRKVHYMAKAELFRIPIFNAIIASLGAFPVKRGGVSKESIRTALELLKEGGMLGIFPQGSRSNTSGIGKRGAAMLALKSGAAVVPVAITGTYVPFRRVLVSYGRPLDLSSFTEGGSEQQEALTERIMRAIEDLKKSV